MRVLIIALLAAISYAQTAGAGAASGFDPMMYGMYDEMMDLGDMYPEIGDMYDNFMPMMQGMFGGAGTGGSTGAGASSGYFPFLDGDVNDMMSDVVDNMKDGDMQDVMSNLMPLAQMGLPGLDLSSLMGPNGMPNLNGMMQAISPYLAMDGDMYGDFGDLYKMGGDLYEDFYKYGGFNGQGMQAMGGDIASMMGQMGMGGMMGMEGGEYEMPSRLQKAHKLRKRLRRRRPSRLLKKTNRKLRKPREFPWYAFTNPSSSSTGSQSGSGRMHFPFFGGFDAPDSEDIQNFLMMGGDRSAIPPPLDGIDMEDMWMYRGTKWDPMAMFNKATTQTNADGTPNSAFQPWLYAMLSSLQKAHQQRKH